MKILLGDFVVGASGSQGGSVYARNRYGAYKRNRTIPVNPDTPAQQAQKAILSAFAQAWRVLSQVQRDAWDGAVDNFIGTDVFAAAKRFSGNVLYTRLNSVLASVGAAAISAPPLPIAVPSAAVGALTVTNTPYAFTVAYAAPGAGFATQIWATPPVSPGVSYVKNLYKLIDSQAGTVVSPLDIEAAYLAVYGVPPVGTKVFVKIIVVSTLTGIRSVGTSNYAIVA